MRGSLLLLILLLVPAAAGHSTAFQTEPDPLTGLPEAPEYVRIRFTEPMDFDRSFIGIFDDDLLRRDAGDAHVDPDDPAVVQVYTGNLIKGIYTVSYETYSSVDGHQERGSLPLTIGVPCTSCLEAPAQGSSLAGADIDGDQSAARFLGYVATAGLLGFALFARYAMRRPTWAPRIAAAAGLGVTASGLWVGQQVAGVAGPQLEALVMVRILAGVTAALAAWRWGAGHPLTLGAGAVAGIALAGTGHGDRSLTQWSLQSLHVLALLAWVGGIAAAILFLARHRQGRFPTMQRFSHIATFGVGVLVLTGTLLGIRNLRTPDDLVGTAYGQAIVVKLLLSGVLLGFGARNHLRLRPGKTGIWSGMRRDLRIEAGAAVLLLVATGALAGLSLPTDLPGPPPKHTEEAWWGDHLVRLEISPAGEDGGLRPGDHIQKVRLLDLSRRPVEGARVEMGFTNRVLDVGAISAEATELGRGWYETRGTQLGAVGEWELEVRFREPGSEVVREARFLIDMGVVGHVHGGVRISDPHFDSGYLDQGGRFERRFGADTVGSFEYHCHPHQWMQGTIEVNASAPAAPGGVVEILMHGDAGDEQGEMYFEPREVRIPPGTVVRWINVGSAPHTATNVQWYAP